MRVYSGIPASNNEVDTIQLDKATDNPQHTYHTYLETSGTSLSTLWNERADVAYFNLFTVSPPTGDQVSNSLNLHATKSLTEIDPPGNLTGSSIVMRLVGLQGNEKLPASAIRGLSGQDTTVGQQFPSQRRYRFQQ